jgi:hypothetical protein
MLRPNGANLSIGRKFTTRGLCKRFVEGSGLSIRKRKHGLFVARKLKEEASEVILHFWRQGANGINGLFE